MDYKQKWDIIHQCYEALNRIHRPIKACRNAHLSPDLLRDNDIVISQLNWHPEDVIDFEPRYCEPCPIERFETLFKRTKATNYQGRGTAEHLEWDYKRYEWVEDESSRPLKESACAVFYLESREGWVDNPVHMAAKGDWFRCAGSKLYKDRGSQWNDGSPSRWYFWGVRRSLPWPQDELPTDEGELQRLKKKLRGVSRGDMPIAFEDVLRRPGKKSLVHMAITVHDNSDLCEERILRSELISAIYIIRDGMRQRRYIKQHGVYPVFVYSWSSFHVRVLQVHYDWNISKLVVRKTSYITINGPHCEAEIKLMLRWMMNTPKGVTRWEELDLTERASKVKPASTDRPPSPKKLTIRSR